MSTSAYLGVSSTARKLKTIYIGVNGVARKVKKAWIGVNGVARLWWKSNVPLTWYRQTTMSASAAARYNAITNVNGSVAIRYGQTSGGGASSTIDIINDDLSRQYSSVSQPRRECGSGAYSSTHGFFSAGSTRATVSGYVSTVDAINSSFTTSTAASVNTACVDMFGGTIGGKALVCGGLNASSSNLSQAFFYNDSLTQTSLTSLRSSSSSFANRGTANTSSKVLVGWGSSTGYDSNGTQYAVKNFGAGGTINGEKAIVSNVVNRLSTDRTVTIINDDLTTTSATSLTNNGGERGTTECKGYAMFGGGRYYNSGTTYYNTVDIYDYDGVKQTSLALSQARGNPYSQSTENHVIFVAGTISSYSSRIDVFSYNET